MKKEYFETTSTIKEGDIKRFIGRVHYEAMCNLDDGTLDIMQLGFFGKIKKQQENPTALNFQTLTV